MELTALNVAPPTGADASMPVAPEGLAGLFASLVGAVAPPAAPSVPGGAMPVAQAPGEGEASTETSLDDTADDADTEGEPSLLNGLPPLAAAQIASPLPMLTANLSPQPVAIDASVKTDTGSPIMATSAPVLSKSPDISPAAELARAMVPADKLPPTASPIVAAVAKTAQSVGSQAPAPSEASEPSVSEGGVVRPAPVLTTPTIIAQPPANVIQAPSPSTVEPTATPEPTVAVDRMLDLARDGAWLDQLAKDIARTAASDGPLRFRLHPEHLGSLHVEMAQNAAGASVRFTVETEAARTALVDAQPRLIAEARAQGLRVAESHVDLGSQGGQPQSQTGQRDPRQQPGETYLTSWKPESRDDRPAPPRRSAAERYA